MVFTATQDRRLGAAENVQVTLIEYKVQMITDIYHSLIKTSG